MLELNSETDFVSRNEEFAAVADALGRALLADTSFDGIVDDATGAEFLQTVRREDRRRQDHRNLRQDRENVVLRRTPGSPPPGR
jgi:translation elongation factor EF-Ts